MKMEQNTLKSGTILQPHPDSIEALLDEELEEIVNGKSIRIAL